ncbi:hypothetical protein HWV62_20900 [Athelia sp. TMB]|nr:hypothetical protein HWV62_28682 [Athelia sp. TMB]KAF7971512.1 hypothetical protein HWV62_20900 [Athelia sp. TMB]
MHVPKDRRDILGVGALLTSLPVVGPALVPLIDALGLGSDHPPSKAMFAENITEDQAQAVQEAIAQASAAITSQLGAATALLPVPVPVALPTGLIPGTVFSLLPVAAGTPLGAAAVEYVYEEVPAAANSTAPATNGTASAGPSSGMEPATAMNAAAPTGAVNGTASDTATATATTESVASATASASNIAFSRALLDHQSLTPRTPHSRASRAEEACGDYRPQQYEEDDLGTYDLQSESLLVSSASDSFPLVTHGPTNDRRQLTPASNTFVIAKLTPSLLFGGCLTLILFVMTLVSFEKPGILLRIMDNGNAAEHPEGLDSQSPPAASTPRPYDPNVISYENYTQFPLLPNQYATECQKLMGGFMHHGKYWEESPKDTYHPEYRTGNGDNVCSGTITYQLGGQVGLLADLGLLAQVAGLARERNKTFLVDDTYWNRGSWIGHFEDVRLMQPGPEPGCKPPPSEAILRYGHELNRLKPIFETAARSFSETIKPNSRNRALIKLARDELAGVVDKGPLEYIGVHLRRGDRHAISWRYKGGYVPTSEYAEAVNATSVRLFADVQAPVPLYIASDLPAAEFEVVDALSASRIVMSLSRSSLPQLNEVASRREYVQTEFNQLQEGERESLTRGAIVDFAMLSGMWAVAGQSRPRATICTLSSSICRLSAVGLGWDRAFGEVDKMGNADDNTKGWVEIDNANNIDPSWEAFELFG